MDHTATPKSLQQSFFTDTCEDLTRASLLGLRQVFDIHSSKTLLDKSMSTLEIPRRKLLTLSSWAIRRSNKIRSVFAAGVYSLTFYSVITSLYFLSFREPTDKELVVDYIVQGAFAVDIAVQPFLETRREKSSGVLLTLKWRTTHYIRTWLLWDFLAIFPFREMHFASIGYLLRLSRVYKMYVVLDKLQSEWLAQLTVGAKRVLPKNTFKVKFVLSLGSLLFWMMFILYASAVAFVYYRKLVVDLGYGEEYRRNDGVRPSVLDEMYLMLSTLSTVGYGDLQFNSVYDWLFLTFVLFPGIALYSFIIANLSNMLLQYRAFTGESDPMPSVLAWVSDIEYRFGQLDPVLSQRIIRHFQFYAQEDRLGPMAQSYWRTEGSYAAIRGQPQEYVSQLPPKLQREVFDYVFKDVFYTFRLFFGSGLFKYEICAHLQPREFLPGEAILEEKEVPREVILVLSGRVGCGLMLGINIHSLIVFEKGRTVVGDYGVLTGTQSPATYSVLGETSVQALAVPKIPLLAILNEGFPELRNSVFRRALARHNRISRLVTEYSSLLNSKVRSAHGLIVMLLIRICSSDPKLRNLVKALRKLLFTVNPFHHSDDSQLLVAEPSPKEGPQQSHQHVLEKERDWVSATQHSGVLEQMKEIAITAEKSSDNIEMVSISQLDLRSEVTEGLRYLVRRLRTLRSRPKSSDG